ncbi:MAG TPA: DUF167 domain-containing protein [Patescibacteria group bacterium]|nr:DUF167 domain-containing protein [Patescibacteria group bacterium]
MNNVINKYKKTLESEGEVLVDCRLSPQAKNSEIKEIMSDGALKIRVTSVPEKGKANLELRHILSKQFKVPLNNVSIIKGHMSKFKRVSISK